MNFLQQCSVWQIHHTFSVWLKLCSWCPCLNISVQGGLQTKGTYHLFAFSSKGLTHIQSSNCVLHAALDITDTFSPPSVLHSGAIESLTIHSHTHCTSVFEQACVNMCCSVTSSSPHLPVTGSGVFETAAQAVNSVSDELPGEVVLHSSAHMHLFLLNSYAEIKIFWTPVCTMLLDWPDTVSGENVIHLLKVGRAVHHHLLLHRDLNGHTGQHALNEPCPVETLENKRQEIYFEHVSFCWMWLKYPMVKYASHDFTWSAPSCFPNYFKKVGEVHSNNTIASVAKLNLYRFKFKIVKDLFLYIWAME